jgi:hypothetical protein
MHRSPAVRIPINLAAVFFSTIYQRSKRNVGETIDPLIARYVLTLFTDQ